MSINHNFEMGISEAELSLLTRELDTLHKETFPQARIEIADMGSRVLRSQASRRGVIAGGLGLVGAAALAACGSSSSTSKASGTPSAATSASGATSVYTGDLKVVALAAALENLAVTGYGLALTMAGKNQLGTVPPAIATFITTAKGQHADHASAWNAVLTGAKLPAVTTAPLTITASTAAAVMASKTVVDVAKVAVSLEQAAAETYLLAVGAVTDAGGIATAATIAPVEAMHAAILNYVLGNYPVPDDFLKMDKAVQPSALTV